MFRNPKNPTVWWGFFELYFQQNNRITDSMNVEHRISINNLRSILPQYFTTSKISACLHAYGT